jgi:Arc/MetJ-type ribon-helix-helix transcriptional regulator
MQRVCVRLPDEQVEGIDQRVEAGEFPNPSEAIRAAIREWLNDDDGSADPRSHLRPDGGHVASGPAATSRDPRRREHDSVRSYEHGGLADQGQCPHVDPGEPPCAECFFAGGDN